MTAACKGLCHYVWEIASESLEHAEGEQALPLDFAGIAHMVARCVHCGRVSKRWREDLERGRAQAAASVRSHASRCRSRPVVAGAGRWVGAGGRMN